MSAGPYAVILVHSTSHALRGEKLLLQAGIPSKMIPVPRHLSSSCGLCVRIGHADRQASEEILKRAGLEIEAICRV